MTVKELRAVLDLATKSLAAVTTELRVEMKDVPKSADLLIIQNLCMTKDGVNSDEAALEAAIDKTLTLKRELLSEVTAPRVLPVDSLWDPAGPEEYEAKLKEVEEKEGENADANSLRQIVLAGLKGIATYAWEAYQIGYEDEGIDPFLQRVLQRTLKFTLSVGLLFNLSMEVGGFGYRSMGLLDNARIERYGSPKLTNIELGARTKPGILVAGGDIRALECLLEQTKGTGVEVYTHDELMSAHCYPNLSGLDHFAGNYGGSAATQQADYTAFNGPIVVTGGVIEAPEAAYADRIYTTGVSGFPGVPHLDTDNDCVTDFSAVIEQAKTLSAPSSLRMGEVVTGFGHDQLYSMGEMLQGAIEDESIAKIITVIGADGKEEARSYVSDVVAALPKNALVMTAGPVKYRFNDQYLGTLRGMPRTMDIGAVSDTYSFCMTALKLQADLGKYDINGVPITYLVSLGDEKAMTALLTLIYIGAKNLVVFPGYPDYMTDSIIGVFEKNFGLRLATTAAEDVEAFFAKKPVNSEGPIDPNMLIIDIIEKYPEAAQVLMNCGMSCVTCGAALYESLSEACMVHGLDPEDVKQVLDHELGLVED
ncbi:MAG: hydroxylamine reductase [Clostridia bacterium]|nr:hydroxylamine reductase [Clostridia bacterium]